MVQELKVAGAVGERKKRKNPCPHSEDSNSTQKTQDTWIVQIKHFISQTRPKTWLTILLVTFMQFEYFNAKKR